MTGGTEGPGAGDAGFEGLLYEYIDRLNAGEVLDKQRIREEHPEQADLLIARLQVFEQVGRAEEPRGAPVRLGDYTIRREIGRGGMGVVYEAWESSVERPVALKVLPAGIAADPRASARFLREAQAAGRLSHPHIVAVHATGVYEGTPYYSMEYVEGETLAQVLAREKRLPPHERTCFGIPREDVACFSTMARAFADVAEGLQHAHSRGVVHRDIKPSNLILDRQLRVRILDFGLARLEGKESITASGDFLGTPLYMSPEQARRRRIPLDHRTDVYSLGATLYEMLTWRPPFQGRDHQETLTQIIERDPVEPRRLDSRVPKDMEVIVLKCLRKDPGDRYGTAEALAQDLRRFARGDPVEARSEPGWAMIARRVRRHRLKLLLLAAASIALLALGWLDWKRQVAEHEALRLVHDKVILEAAKDLFRGQMTLPGFEDVGMGDMLFKRRKIRRGDPALDATLRSLTEVAAAVPERPDAPYYLARLHRFLGDKGAAAREARRALERDPGFVPAEVLSLELSRGTQLDDPTIEDLLARYRAGVGWQEPWLLAYRQKAQGNRIEAAEAFGRLLSFREKNGEPYVGYTVEALMGQGLALFVANDLPAAIRAFAAARRQWTVFPEAGVFLGISYYRKGDLDEAERVFADLFREFPEDSKNELASWIAVAYGQVKDGAKKSEWAERVTGWERNRLNAFFFYYDGLYEECAEEAHKVLDASPEDRLALVFLGASMLYMQWDRFGPVWDRVRREILEIAQKSIDLYPASPAGEGLLAYALEVNGDHEGALERAERVMQLERSEWRESLGLLTMGTILRLQGALERAEKTLRLGLEKRQNGYWLRQTLARTMEDGGRFEEALSEYRWLAERTGGSAIALSGLTRVLCRLGRYEEAAECASRAVDLPPKNTSAHESLAFALWKLGRREEALEWADAGIRALPGRLRLNVVRGRVLATLEKHGEAAATLCEAIEMHPGYGEAHEALREMAAGLEKPALDAVTQQIEAVEKKAPGPEARGMILQTLSVLRGKAGAPKKG